MADKEIRIGDISNGDIPNPDAKWSVDGNGHLTLDLAEGHTIDNDNGALEVDERASVADAGKVAISEVDAALGYALIQDVTNDTSAMVYLGGGANTVEILHDSGSGNNYTTTEDNDGTTNVYWDAGNSRYELNNETGGSVTYAVEVLRA
jgi:hypothetical protein